MRYISTEKAPAAIGPYSQAVATEEAVYCSGQVGLDPQTGELVGSGIEEQTRQVFAHIKNVLAQADLTLKDIVKTTVFLAHMDDFEEMNEVYQQELGDHQPARSTIGVAGLPLNALVEIESMATKSSPR
ncbi:MAG: hypothetical protein GF398_09160 [Chitinivibrionales bacterium]|nr:hypothetical protein [Chitinivibrionales bacterium]